jgi:hypothetical protein
MTSILLRLGAQVHTRCTRGAHSGNSGYITEHYTDAPLALCGISGLIEKAGRRSREIRFFSNFPTSAIRLILSRIIAAYRHSLMIKELRWQVFQSFLVANGVL